MANKRLLGSLLRSATRFAQSLNCPVDGMMESSYPSARLAVRFFETASGRVPVADYIEGLPSERSEQILAALEDLERQGIQGATVSTRHIEGKLWELKFPDDRFFYAVLSGPELVLLHAYKKQGRKAPLKELETARKRLKLVMNT